MKAGVSSPQWMTEMILYDIAYLLLSNQFLNLTI